MATQFIPSAPGDATHAVAITAGATVYNPPFSSLYIPSSATLTFIMSNDTVAVTISAPPIGMLTGFLIKEITACPAGTIGFY